MAKLRVAVIFGGQSSEHEVSRISATSVIKNIDTSKYDVAIIGITKEGRWLPYSGDIEKLATGEWQVLAEEYMKNEVYSVVDITEANTLRAIIKKLANGSVDVIFPVLHGINCEDGTLQGLFELAGLPYVGPGVLGSSLGMDKAYAKIVFEKEGIPQVGHLTYSRREVSQDIDNIVRKVEEVLGYPCFVKPSNAGSSVGVSKAHERKELIEALKLASIYDIRILIEECKNIREIECAVLGNENPMASVVGEVVASNEFYDYNAKYIDNKSEIIIPADIPEETSDLIREYAVRAYKSLDCSGLSRVDFFLDKDTGRVYLNEINTLPGFTSISMYPKMWSATGIEFQELITKLLELAIERFEYCKRKL